MCSTTVYDLAAIWVPVVSVYLLDDCPSFRRRVCVRVCARALVCVCVCVLCVLCACVRVCVSVLFAVVLNL